MLYGSHCVDPFYTFLVFCIRYNFTREENLCLKEKKKESKSVHKHLHNDDIVQWTSNTNW